MKIGLPKEVKNNEFRVGLTPDSVGELSLNHKVLEITSDQILDFCGNSLEVEGENGNLMLAMSSRAYSALDAKQKDILLKHYKKIIHSDLATIEKYGGGSARCMLSELF